MYYLSILETYDDTPKCTFCNITCGKTDIQEEGFYDNEQGSYWSIGTCETLAEVKDVLLKCQTVEKYLLEFTGDVDSREINYLTENGVIIPDRTEEKG